MKHYNVTVSLRMKEIDTLFCREDQINIYRIFQEALNNIVKHAQASTVSIAIEVNRNTVFFSIEDNGKGFEEKSYRKKSLSEKGLGITTMEERVRMLGGSFKLRSGKGKGTSLMFMIPAKRGE